MPFSPVVLDRERDKFVENPAGETSVRVFVSNESGDALPISGSFSAAAPTGPVKTSQVTVTDTAANPIPTALANRVSLVVRNTDAVNTVYFGEDNTVTPATGWEIGPNEDFSIDLDDSNVFFLIAATGLTAVVKFLEVASSAGGGGGGGVSYTREQETPVGLINSSNTAYTITAAPVSDDYFSLYQNGLLLELVTDYTRSGTAITLVVAPPFGAKLKAIYWY